MILRQVCLDRPLLRDERVAIEKNESAVRNRDSRASPVRSTVRCGIARFVNES